MYIKMMVDGMTSKPFSAKTYASPDDKITNLQDKVVETSRQRYGTNVKIVDEKIRRWVEMPFDYGMAIAEQKRGEADKNKEVALKLTETMVAEKGEENIIDSKNEINGTIKIER